MNFKKEFLVLSVMAVMLSASCTKKSSETQTPQGDSTSVEAPAAVSTEVADATSGSADSKNSSNNSESKGATMDKNGVKIEEKTVGTGALAVSGKSVTVHYTGTLLSGKKFDSSVDRGEPFSFVLGSGMVIQGWDIGVEGMKVGGKRILTIPADKAYGDRDVGGGLIPAGSTLVFEVELLNVGA